MPLFEAHSLTEQWATEQSHADRAVTMLLPPSSPKEQNTSLFRVRTGRRRLVSLPLREL